MMKFTGALTTGLAVFIALPALALEDYRATSLKAAMEETLLAIDTLKGVSKSLEEKPEPGMVDLVLELTEAPPLPQRELDELLVKTRDEVDHLQQKVDLMEARHAGIEFTGSIYRSERRGMTTGIDANLLRTLQSIGSFGDAEPALTHANGGAEGAAGGKGTGPRTGALGPDGQSLADQPDPARPRAPLEAKGYSADPLSQAVAAFRAKRYSDALLVLGEPGDDAHLWYWRSRILGGLERVDDALTGFRKVIDLAPESFEAKQAAVEIEFLEWRREFSRKLPSTKLEQASTPK